MSETSQPNDHQYSFKFVLVGDSAVGKTAICKRFCENIFNANQAQTVGLEFGTRIVDVQNSRIKLQIWDTAGQERFHSITRAYFRSSAAVFLVFDISNRESFNHVGRWVEEANELSPKTAIKVLVGNKTDLDAQRQVSTAEAKDFADQQGLTLFETSAFSNDRIDDTFIETAQAVLEKINKGEIEPNNPTSGARAPLSVQPQLTEQNTQQNSGGCC